MTGDLFEAATYTVGEAYQFYWEERVEAAFVSARTAFDRANRLARRLGEPVHTGAVIADGSALAVDAKSIINQLITRILAAGVPDGHEIRLDRESLVNEFLSHKAQYGDVDHLKCFSPRAVWEEISRRYSPEVLHEKAMQNMAENIAAAFSLGPNNPPKKRANGCTVISSYWTRDSFFPNQLSYNYRRELEDGFRSIGLFLNSIGETESAEGLRGHYLHDDSSAHIRSREKYICSSKLQLVTYLNKIEWIFAPDISQALQIFLAKYNGL